MKSYTLGPPVETFGPNIRITTVFGAFGLFICTLAFLVAHEIKDSTAWRIFLHWQPYLRGRSSGS